MGGFAEKYMGWEREMWGVYGCTSLVIQWGDLFQL